MVFDPETFDIVPKTQVKESVLDFFDGKLLTRGKGKGKAQHDFKLKDLESGKDFDISKAVTEQLDAQQIGYE